MSIDNTIEQPVVDVLKKRGNPNWVKKEEKIMKADVITESSPTDIWMVKNKVPGMHYVFGRKSNDVEMNDFVHKGYRPALGSEQIMGNPFEAVKDTTGQTKERGDRILMCCPQELVDAREAARVGRSVSAQKEARAKARGLTRKGVLVRPEVEEVTRRESFEA